MKILSIGNFTLGWDGSICDEEHIAQALTALGHEVIRVQREHLVLEGFQRDNQPDFALIAQWDGYPPQMFNLLRQYVPRVVYWAFDYQADGQEWHQKLVHEADLYLSKRIEDSHYPNWQWLSQDFAPEFLERAIAEVKDIDVLFTGSYLPWAVERNDTLKAVDNRFDLTIHSVNEWPGYKNVQPGLMDAQLPELYGRAKVILSIDHTPEAGYWSDRNAQIMCCGRRPLFRYVPMSEGTFHHYVDYFYNIKECLDMIQFKLNHPEPNGWDEETYKFAQANLKATNRVRDLLTIVGGLR